MDEPTVTPPIQPLDPLAAAETSMLTALHAMAHAAGLAMMAGPQTQASARHLAIARLTRIVVGMTDPDAAAEIRGLA
ncbi:hypothetical protein WV31_19355 [Magnetospirillum sp. ME-1]|uniref:hypothetical protein n=1 Tax=Magnetospirillum sp. ME-1 TaxID=1639348 RepID=UPI000A179D9C|nr:hypothetical protein [Magnetospirillum sp. ME-1]ARJ67657.1 hypothetical protein WV31_19355 [Magnetospirillum sp. ME-1]